VLVQEDQYRAFFEMRVDMVGEVTLVGPGVAQEHSERLGCSCHQGTTMPRARQRSRTAVLGTAGKQIDEYPAIVGPYVLHVCTAGCVLDTYLEREVIQLLGSSQPGVWPVVSSGWFL
jgi:hypothetical protein